MKLLLFIIYIKEQQMINDSLVDLLLVPKPASFHWIRWLSTWRLSGSPGVPPPWNRFWDGWPSQACVMASWSLASAAHYSNSRSLRGRWCDWRRGHVPSWLIGWASAWYDLASWLLSYVHSRPYVLGNENLIPQNRWPLTYWFFCTWLIGVLVETISKGS